MSTTGILPFAKKPKPAGGDDKLAWLRLTRTENIGPVSFYQLVETYGSAQDALNAIPDLAARAGRRKPLKIPPVADIEREYSRLKKMGGDLVIATDDAYPLALGAIADAPPVISIIGNASLMQKPCIGVVGARNSSLNGRKFAEKMARELGEAGQVIVSGFARGIDTAAHQGALDTGTIAVVAGGIDIVYPPENEKFYKEIAEKGLIIAESPLGQKPFAQSFPRRNRIVAGLSAGIVVVEATVRSGSLITARLAGEQGRDVYAVPGHPFDPRAAGPNRLIRDGAILIQSAEDILESIGTFSGLSQMEDSAIPSYQPEPLAIEENTGTMERAREDILAALSYSPVQVDDLIRTTHLDVPLVQIALLELELAGQIRRLPGNRIVKIDE